MADVPAAVAATREALIGALYDTLRDKLDVAGVTAVVDRAMAASGYAELAAAYAAADTAAVVYADAVDPAAPPPDPAVGTGWNGARAALTGPNALLRESLL